MISKHFFVDAIYLEEIIGRAIVREKEEILMSQRFTAIDYWRTIGM